MPSTSSVDERRYRLQLPMLPIARVSAGRIMCLIRSNGPPPVALCIPADGSQPSLTAKRIWSINPNQKTGIERPKYAMNEVMLSNQPYWLIAAPIPKITAIISEIVSATAIR